MMSHSLGPDLIYSVPLQYRSSPFMVSDFFHTTLILSPEVTGKGQSGSANEWDGWVQTETAKVNFFVLINHNTKKSSAKIFATNLFYFS